LSGEEVDALGAFLMGLKDDPLRPVTRDIPGRISAFGSRKARVMMTDKLACLGCHQLGELGGRIGPDLTRVRERLQPAYVYQVIKDPGSVHPQMVMPRIPMPDATVELLTGFLLGTESGTALPAEYLSPADHPVIPLDSVTGGDAPEARARANYLRYCAACHGNEGRGDGFNAAYLPVKPTMHADGVHMATRPDDTLYDGIHNGGYILNKSARMPPWGGTLSAGEIQALVGYLRKLCQCQGPAWSRDGVGAGAAR
jgi:mono/diheme cytochrome c family protein